MDPQKWGQPGLATLGWPRFCSHDVDVIVSYRRAGMLWMSSKLHTEFGRSFSVLTLLWLHRRCKACQQALLSRKIESIEYITPSLVYHSTVGTADIFHYYLLHLTSVACLQRRSIWAFGTRSYHLHKWPTRLIFYSRSKFFLVSSSYLTFAPRLNQGQPFW